jgi:5'-nucleotidase
MKILVSNDDGIYSEGIWDLAAIGKSPRLYGCPGPWQSAVGTAVSLRKPLRVQKISPRIGVEAYSVEGTL